MDAFIWFELITLYTWQEKKLTFFNINLTSETVIKFYPELYEYVKLDSCVRSGPFHFIRHYTGKCHFC